MSDAAKPSNGEIIDITDSLGRKIKLKTLGPADMLNLLEAAGANSGNAAWVRMAMIAASVREIDGVPLPVALDKKTLLNGANKLGNEGLIAATRALFGETEPVAEDAAEGDEAAAPPAMDEAVQTSKN